MDEIHHTPMDTSTDSPSLDSMKTDYDDLRSSNLETRIHVRVNDRSVNEIINIYA